MRSLDRLKNILEELGSTLIAYSGGVDSSFLLAVASTVLKDNVIAATAVSPIRSEKDLENSKKITDRLGVRHIIVNSDELGDKNVRNNTVERCYFCKKIIFQKMLVLADQHGLNAVCEASNASDAKEYRPGEKAIKELKIRSPLKEAGLTKKDIRSISKEMGLETWDAPSQSCFLTRFPYGTRIEIEEIDRVKKAESFLEDLGFGQIRTRVYGDLVRIEVPPGEIKKISSDEIPNKVVNKLKSLGYNYITLDLEGYRTGSMDIKLK